MKLILDPNLGADADRAYERLVQAYEGLSEEDSAQLSARLILILVNHIGDAGVLDEALAIARET